MYDLVIIGASPEGISAAQRGIRKYPTARIALVVQGWQALWAEKTLIQPFNHLCFVETDLGETLRQLAVLGVDVIPESGNFKQTAAGLVWSMPQRELTADAYLLTTDSGRYLATPSITTDLFTPPENSSEGKIWGIWGALPENLIVAQNLAQQGHPVELFSRNAHLLPGEDREMGHLLQCYLESLGIKFRFNCQQVTLHLNADGQTHGLSVRDGGEPREVAVAGFWRSPLPALPWHWCQTLPQFSSEIESNSPSVAVNDYLQTAHAQIFACGGWLKGYASPAITIQESHYVVDRVLGHRQRAIDYGQMPFGIDLAPPWYRIGLNERQAGQRGGKVHVYHGYEPYRGDCPLRGCCKIITNPEDQIVGAHWFGPSAPAGISLLTLAILKELTVEALQTLPVVDRGVAQVLQDLCQR